MSNKVRDFFLPANTNAANRARIFGWFLVCFLICLFLGIVNGYHLGRSNDSLMMIKGVNNDVSYKKKIFEADSLQKLVKRYETDSAGLNNNIDSLVSISQLLINYSFDDPTKNLDLKSKLQSIGIHPSSKIQSVRLALHNCIINIEKLRQSTDSLTRENSIEIRNLAKSSTGLEKDMDKANNENRALSNEIIRLKSENLGLKTQIATAVKPSANNTDKETAELTRKLDAALNKCNELKGRRKAQYTSQNILTRSGKNQ